MSSTFQPPTSITTHHRLPSFTEANYSTRTRSEMDSQRLSELWQQIRRARKRRKFRKALEIFEIFKPLYRYVHGGPYADYADEYFAAQKVYEYLLDQAGLSPKEISKSLDIDHSYVSKVERRAWKGISIGKITELLNKGLGLARRHGYDG